jgi:hypothetical protein
MVRFRIWSQPWGLLSIFRGEEGYHQPTTRPLLPFTFLQTSDFVFSPVSGVFHICCFILVPTTGHNMAADVAFDLLVEQLCSLLHLSVKRHAYYHQFMGTRDMVMGLMSIVSPTFAPGLVSTYYSSEPPTIDFFKTLPEVTDGKWGVYSVVLEKENCKPQLYIGSGTQATDGVQHRINQYQDMEKRPKFVQRAIEKGYQITHIGLFCWAPIPALGNTPFYRLLFLSLEALFSYTFWAMISRRPEAFDTDAQSLCPWKVQELEYDGCCTHNSLNECPKGQYDLSPEEIEAAAARRKIWKAENTANFRAKAIEQDAESYRAHVSKLARDRRKRPGVREMERNNKRRYQAKAKAERRFYCEVCDMSFSLSIGLKRHKTRKIHRKGLAAQRARTFFSKK